MRKRVVIYATAVMIATALLIISALPIIRPRYFAWSRGKSFFELSIQGFLPPHGAQRGIHFETFPLGPELRFRVLSIDFAFVAWEFVITEHLPVERPNQAMPGLGSASLKSNLPSIVRARLQRTASEPAIYLLRVCHPRLGCESRFLELAVADLVSR
jgi:hypothetical protein